MKEAIKDIHIETNRPNPLAIINEIAHFNYKTDIPATIKILSSGKQVLIKGLYSNGSNLLSKLHAYLKKKHPGESYFKQRMFRKEYRKLSNLVLIEIHKNKLVVKKAPSIGWLEKLYPNTENFLLTFPQIQGMNSSWQWYVNGINIPVLRNKIHPYYGVYFPTRFEHLQLFDNWLKRYDGPKKTAIDVGIGSGVLSLQMMKYGFQKSFGTDTNPNAIIGIKELVKGTKFAVKMEIDHSHLFGKWDKQTELIVFNPPWLPAAHNLEHLDEAMYYNDELFPEFFKEAKKRLLPDGQIVILFSNLGEIVKATKNHPIKEELSNESRFTLKKYLKKSVKRASTLTTRNQHWRSLEEVELWVLKHNEQS